MKKSEILVIIENQFYETGCEPDDAETEAAELLNKLEQKGMSPPSIINPNFQGGHNIDIEPYYISEWEPEDDNN